MNELKYGFRESWPKIIIDVADILYDCNLGKVTLGNLKVSSTVPGHYSLTLEITEFTNPKNKLAKINFIWETFKPCFEGDPWAGVWMTVRSMYWTEYDRWNPDRILNYGNTGFRGVTKYDESDFIIDIISEIYQGLTKKDLPAHIVDAVTMLESKHDITGYCSDLTKRPLFMGAHGGWFVLTRGGRVSRNKKPMHTEFKNNPMFDLVPTTDGVCSKILLDYIGKPLVDAISELRYVAEYGFETTVLENPIIDNPERYAENARFFEKSVIFPTSASRCTMETFEVSFEIKSGTVAKFKEIVKDHPMDLVNWLAPKVIGNKEIECLSGAKGIYGALFEYVWVYSYRSITIEFTSHDELY